MPTMTILNSTPTSQTLEEFDKLISESQDNAKLRAHVKHCGKPDQTIILTSSTSGISYISDKLLMKLGRRHEVANVLIENLFGKLAQRTGLVRDAGFVRDLAARGARVGEYKNDDLIKNVREEYKKPFETIMSRATKNTVAFINMPQETATALATALNFDSGSKIAVGARHCEAMQSFIYHSCPAGKKPGLLGAEPPLPRYEHVEMFAQRWMLAVKQNPAILDQFKWARGLNDFVNQHFQLGTNKQILVTETSVPEPVDIFSEKLLTEMAASFETEWDTEGGTQKLAQGFAGRLRNILEGKTPKEQSDFVVANSNAFKGRLRTALLDRIGKQGKDMKLNKPRNFMEKIRNAVLRMAAAGTTATGQTAIGVGANGMTTIAKAIVRMAAIDPPFETKAKALVIALHTVVDNMYKLATANLLVTVYKDDEAVVLNGEHYFKSESLGHDAYSPVVVYSRNITDPKDPGKFTLSQDPRDKIIVRKPVSAAPEKLLNQIKREKLDQAIQIARESKAAGKIAQIGSVIGVARTVDEWTVIVNEYLETIASPAHANAPHP